MKIVSMSRRPTPPNNTNSELDDLLEFVESTLNKADINKTLVKVSKFLNHSQDSKAEKAKNLNLDNTLIARIKH